LLLFACAFPSAGRDFFGGVSVAYGAFLLFDHLNARLYAHPLNVSCTQGGQLSFVNSEKGFQSKQGELLNPERRGERTQ
jgi:hypothetical protein